jgi:hypothetical protein
MAEPSILEWMYNSSLSQWIREGGLPYPIIGALHLLSIALFGGMLLFTDLRILGWAMPQRKVSDLILQLRPWKWLGFFVVVTTGILLMWSEPIRLYHSPSFWTKMVFFALVGVHAAVFRPGVYANPEKLDSGITGQAKLAALLSMILWTGLIVCGRFIAFDASFDQ